MMLKNCPFCGGVAETFKRGTKYGTICFVQCMVCRAQTKVLHIKAEVMDDDWTEPQITAVQVAWNTRTAESEVVNE